MVSKLSQRLRVRAALPPQDINAAKTSPYLAVAGYGQIMAVVTTANVAATKKVTAQFLQATDAAGTGSKVLGAPVVVTAPTGGAPLDLAAEAYTERLDEGFGFVAVQLSTDAAVTTLASAMLVSGDSRYRP